jgi:hypothetical protein
MKILLLIITVFLFIGRIFGQEIPNDSILLKTIFGQVDNNGRTATVEKPDEFKDDLWGDSLKYKVVFKQYAFVDGQELLIVVCDATCFMLHGHIFGFRNKYFINRRPNDFIIIKKNEVDEPNPIGDTPDVQIVKIGKTKSALISSFSSTGNHHYERDITFKLITFDGFKDLINIQMDYSNEAWIDSKIPEQEKCMIRSYMSTFQIIESDKEWFDIKIEKIIDKYSNGCSEKTETKESKIYSFIDNGYKLIK